MNVRSIREMPTVAAQPVSHRGPFSNAAEIEIAAGVLKAIADPLRLHMLCVIAERELCVQEVAAAVSTTHSAVSKHLAILHQGKVLVRRKDANKVYYRIGDGRFMALMAMIRTVFCPEQA